MNIFEIINKKEYENLSVINDGKKFYTLKEIKWIYHYDHFQKNIKALLNS